ncbi:MAG: class I poly(R)-hydroxyalkanoic acid synthase [Gammaproteobacteria bacterium]|nr:class I poly(R)-hydroxyalkanoic acid synthase [Gammaproteobacteria bacterium]
MADDRGDKGSGSRSALNLIDAAGKLAQENFRRASGQILTGKVNGHATPMPDPLGLGNLWLEFSKRIWTDPVTLARVQMDFWRDFSAIWQNTFRRGFGAEVDPVIAPEPGDRRFSDEAWDENLVFDCIKQTYLLLTRTGRELVSGVNGMDEQDARKLEFATAQMLDALSPTNFAMTNPAVLRETLESRGKNLVDGLNNLFADLSRSREGLNISMTDMEAFEVGKNLAVTPGKVVYQNELMQLIQYAPTTEEVARRPLLVIPPWMNKFYVMDLRPGNSMIQWLVDQGQTVFMISWVNPGAELAHKDFEDYMLEGPLAALDAIEKATGEPEVNAVGYCLGGILLSATLAWMAAKKDARIKSATLLTTMVDFSDTGDVSLFIDEEGIEKLEKQIRDKGYLEGRKVFDTFRVLRANDLVWSFYINNYLMGKSPAPFDLLYWNADSTNMPAAVHTWVMRNLYMDNRLKDKNGVTLAGEPIDVTSVTTPSYVLSTSEDHIAPWKTTYQTSQLFSGPIKFVLGASGHIAGVINPPHKNKYGYWTSKEYPASADDWLAGAKVHEGSWWPDWRRWVSRYSGGKVAARVPGKGGLPAIEDAPGSYVRVRLD